MKCGSSHRLMSAEAVKEKTEISLISKIHIFHQGLSVHWGTASLKTLLQQCPIHAAAHDTTKKENLFFVAIKKSKGNCLLQTILKASHMHERIFNKI